MKIYFIRHGQATHLEEDWSKDKITRQEFIDRMVAWEKVNLTELGINQSQQAVEKLPKNYQKILSSPLPRTNQTAECLNTQNKEIVFLPDLQEIVTDPPKIPLIKKLSIFVWIYICIFTGLINGYVLKVIKKTKELYKLLLSEPEDIIVVSHAMRIRSLIYLAYFLPKLKIIKKDFTPCGISIVECKKM